MGGSVAFIRGGGARNSLQSAANQLEIRNRVILSSPMFGCGYIWENNPLAKQDEIKSEYSVWDQKLAEIIKNRRNRKKIR